MPNLNSYGRDAAPLHAGQTIRLKAAAGRGHGEAAKIVEIRGDKILVHLGYGVRRWVYHSDIVQ
jgi:hypothetical protein